MWLFSLHERPRTPLYADLSALQNKFHDLSKFVFSACKVQLLTPTWLQFIYQNSRLRWNTKLRQVITELHAAVCLAPRTHLHVDFSALQSKSHTSLAHQGIYRMLVKNLSQACRLSLLSLCFCRVTNLTWILTCVFFDIIPPLVAKLWRQF